MLPFVLLIISASCNVNSLFSKVYNIDTTEYYNMPDLYELDDYEKCLGLQISSESNGALYCLVNTQMKSDNSSELYNYIHDFSMKTKQHFRHDKLQRGICINKCKMIVELLGAQADKYSVDDVELNQNRKIDVVNYDNVKEDRINYDKIINICVNKVLMDDYNLSGISTVDYCIRQDINLFTSIGLKIFISSLYDHSCFIKNKDHQMLDYYTTTPTNQWFTLWTSFSLQRNWFRLIAKSKPGFQDYKCIHAIRVFVLIALTFAHSFWSMLAIPFSNPIFVEKKYHDFLSMVMMSGANMTQTFFVAGGILSGIFMLKLLNKQNESNSKILIESIIYRYIRLAPGMIFFIFFNSTWMVKLGSGPFWNKINQSEKQFCRKNWWVNVLFINNYFETNEKCMISSWFLATDFHLTIIGIILTVLVMKYPLRKLHIFGSALMLSFTTTVAVIFYKKLDPVFVIAPEDLRNQLIPATTNYFDYDTPTHMNAGNYILGILIGVLYHKYENKLIKLKRSFIFEVIWHLTWIAGLLISIFGFPYLEHQNEKTFSTAIFGGIMKHYHGVLLGATMFGLILKYGGIISTICDSSVFGVFGKISYSYLVCHLVFIKYFTATATQMQAITEQYMLMLAIGVFLLSNLAAMLLTMCMEIPLIVAAKALVQIMK
ncbi:unnamed protein product [Diamesa serratosioi]